MRPLKQIVPRPLHAALRPVLRSAFRATLMLLPGSAAARLHYARYHKRFPDTNHPLRFTEKIIRRKIYDRDPRMPLLADKVLVKSYVDEALGPGFTTPTLWSGPALPPHAQRNWQPPYVIKANNGSGANIFIRTEADTDWPAIEARSAAWMKTSHAHWAAEWLYTRITPQILIEPYIGGLAEAPWDYKFFVFGGRVHYVEVDTGRETDHQRTFFDRAWNRQEFSLKYPIDPNIGGPPASLSRMIAAAEAMGQGFDFVRIDFYDLDGAPRFGEMTFYPDSGVGLFDPDEYDFKLGALWV